MLMTVVNIETNFGKILFKLLPELAPEKIGRASCRERV